MGLVLRYEYHSVCLWFVDRSREVFASLISEERGTHVTSHALSETPINKR